MISVDPSSSMEFTGLRQNRTFRLGCENIPKVSEISTKERRFPEFHLRRTKIDE